MTSLHYAVVGLGLSFALRGLKGRRFGRRGGSLAFLGRCRFTWGNDGPC